MSYPHLFSPLEIGRLRLRNRIAMSAMGVGITDDDGVFREPAIRYYEERARGGAGLIITEPCAACYPRGAQSKRQPGASGDHFIDGMRELAERVHAHGAAIALQLVHHGKVSRLDTREGRPLLMPSPPRFHGAMDMAADLTRDEIGKLVAASKGKPQIHEATAEDIATVIEEIADAAARAASAGFDAIELHAAHGYLISEFLSPAWNHRDDAYGGDAIGRARLLCEAIQAIKARVGSEVAVWCRIDAAELRTPGGITLDDALQHAELAVAAGAEAIHVSAYADATSGPAFTEAPLVHRAGGYIGYATAIKQRVDVPVIAVGRIEPGVAERLVREGNADLVAMARKMLADPEIADKLAAGRDAEIRPCIYCYRCVAQPFFDLPVHCGVNHGMGRESELTDALAADAANSRRVLVVGGGPAGLEAARLAAERGHHVRLVERTAQLGGRLPYAGALYEPNLRLLHWLIHQVESAGVDLTLGHEAELGDAEAMSAEAVIIATGAKTDTHRRWPEQAIDAFDSTTMLSDDGSPRPEIGANAIVLGGDQIALRIAAWLQAHGRAVTLLSGAAPVAPEMAHPLRWRILDDLRSGGAQIVCNVEIDEVEHTTVQYRIVEDGSEVERQARADTIIEVPRRVTDLSLAEHFRNGGFPTYAIGDCHTSGSLESAFARATEIVLALP